MKLIGSIYIVTEIVKPTKAYFFKDVQVGHNLQVSMEIADPAGASGNGLYATYLQTTNINTGQSGSDSLTTWHTRMKSFVLKPNPKHQSS